MSALLPIGRLERATDIVEEALSHSRSSACFVIVEESSEAELRFANNTTTTNGYRRDRRVTVISFEERAGGTAVGVRSQSGAFEIEALVRASESECKGVPTAEDASELVATSDEDRTYFDEVALTDLSVLSGVLDALPQAFDRASKEESSLFGFARHQLSTTYLGSSTGVRRRHVQPDGTIEVVARTRDGNRSAWVGVGTKDFSDVGFDAIGDRLRERMRWQERRIDLRPGRYEVILPPDAVADLMIPLDGAMSGREAQDGQSVFSSPSGTRVGERLAELPFVLCSDPRYPGLECCPFVVAQNSSADVSVFDNASAIERVEWIRDGRLNRLRYHRAGARRSGASFTPPAENLVLRAGEAKGSIDDLIKTTKRALLVTCLWYIREVDFSTLLLTGLTRDGVYLVEDGAVVGAVNNFRFNESPVDMLARSVEASGPERALSREWNEWMGLTAMPALRVADFNMSSVSPAS